MGGIGIAPNPFEIDCTTIVCNMALLNIQEIFIFEVMDTTLYGFDLL